MSEFQFNDLEGRNDLGEGALRNLQCNIVRSTGRAECQQVFRRFERRDDFAAWLASVATPSSAHCNDERLVNVMFTGEGLNLLGVSREVLERFDPAFRRSTRSLRVTSLLRDPPVQRWDKEHQQPWHAVELYWRSAGSRRSERPGNGNQSGGVTERGVSVGREGEPVKNDQAPRYNYFGLLDGNTNPVFTQEDYEKWLGRTGPSTHTTWKWDPRHKLSTLLVPDPLANEPSAFGSYFVFRKYRLNVEGFCERIAELAGAIAGALEKGAEWMAREYPVLVAPGADAYRSLAKARPSNPHGLLSSRAGVALAQTIFGVGPEGERPVGGSSDDFDYAEDPDGKRCPFSAHARAMNARGSRGVPQFERKTVIARRGISYTSRNERGTLFWCAQANIGDQFEYIQDKWANSNAVNLDHRPVSGTDYVIGRPNPEAAMGALAKVLDRDVNLQGFSELRASEYFFAPSILGFQRLQSLGGAQ